MKVLRDIFGRRRLRSLLTISGIAIGVFALVVLGAVSENSRIQVELVEQYRGDSVTVVDKDSGVSAFTFNSGLRPISLEAIEEIRDMEGVAQALPRVTLLLDPGIVPIGSPPTIVGGFGEDRLEHYTELSDGRYGVDSERGVVTLGANLVESLDARVGDAVELQGRDFEVVGIMDRTLVSAIDQAAMVSLHDAQLLFHGQLGEEYQERIEAEDLVLAVDVIAEDGADADALAARIEREIEDVVAEGPAQVQDGSTQVVALLDMLVFAIAAIALPVGALSVLNTMIMAASERRREIGVKRALGASRRRIARDMLAESALMGAIGGVAGAAVGAAGAIVLGAAIRAASGMNLFTVTPQLLATGVVTAIILGILGGLYPARYAARLDPVDALASE